MWSACYSREREVKMASCDVTTLSSDVRRNPLIVLDVTNRHTAYWPSTPLVDKDSTEQKSQFYPTSVSLNIKTLGCSCTSSQTGAVRKTLFCLNIMTLSFLTVTFRTSQQKLTVTDVGKDANS